MSTEFFNNQWRIPSNENQNKISNYSMDFNGSSDFIDCGSASYLNGLSQFSISTWINLSNAADAKCIISDWNYNTSPFGHFSLKTIDTSGTNYALILFIKKDLSDAGSNAVKTSAIFTENTWYNVVFTYNSGTVTFYIDGSPVSSTVIGTIASNLVNQDGILTIGNWPGLSQYWDGKIDQVSIFDYELSATEVSTLYGGGTAVTNPMTLSPKPIAYYQLGDQSVDNGAIYLVPNNSLSDYVFNFDGSSDFINCGNNNSLQATTALSISAWIKYTSDTPYYRFIVSRRDSSNTNYQFYLLNTTGGSKQLRFVSSGGINSTGSVTVNNWHHVAVTADGGNISFYIDGQPAGTGTIAGINSVADKDFMIGNIPVAGVFEFPGSISNVAIWNTALSTGNIETLYNNGAPGDISSLSPVSWWKLNAADTFDGTDWTINDYGSGGNDGTSSGMDSSNLVVSDLQQTSGYSPYALDFDGVDDYLTMTSTDFKGGGGTVSYSFWVKPETYGNPPGVQNFGYFISDSSTGGGIAYSEGSTGFGMTPGQMYLYNITNAGAVPTLTSTIIEENVWNNIIVVFNTGNIVQFYKNGSLSSTLTGITSYNATFDTIAARRYPGGVNNPLNGDLSNFSIFDTALTSTQVTEIYNEGVPSNLNTFSGTAPVSWWQIGSNSSYNSGAWTCLDEIGNNNAVSVNMTNSDIVDGPGYSASGLGTSSIDIKGDAPYSTANGLSENMDVLDRTTDVPS